jgi:nitrous oxidase accessory protein NosD
VTIKGLTVTNPNGGPESFVGVKVANGIQTKNGSDSSGLVVRNNTIENIGTALTDTTLSDGAGILLFDTNDVLVEDNIIKGVRGGVEPDPYRSAKGIHIGDSNHGSSDITIKDNDISDIKNFGESHDAHGVLIYTGDTSGIKILDNSISDIVGSAGDGVSLGGVASDVRIKGNTFEDMKSYRRTDDEAGIAIGFWGGTPSTFEVHKNNLLTEIGVANWVPGTTIDATRNYWGEEFGPPGKGKGLDSKGPKEKVEGGVEFHPWLPNPVGKPEKPGVVNPGPPSNKGPRVESFSVTPNPTRSNQQVTFKAQGSAVNQVRVKVFNSVGLQVYDSNFQAGSTVTWNLVGKSGERLANGLYLFTLSAKVDGDLQRSGVRRLLVIN